MNTLVRHTELLDPVPGSILQVIAALEREAGRVNADRERFAAQLEGLVEIARIQSTEASNAIEDIKAPSDRIKALMRDSTAPTNRTEAQIAGYRFALDLIHTSRAAIPFSENFVKQLHKEIYRYTNVRHAGDYKIGDNTVTETHPDGIVRIRFKPVSPMQTRIVMPEMHDRFDALRNAEAHHPLILLGAYVFDYLMVHPFQDGNGRSARLITLLLLYHAGHDIGRYISVERLINDSRETYYAALERSTAGWHDGQHDIWPWMEYLLGIIQAAYNEFAERLSVVSGGPGAKRRAVREFIRTRMVAEFTIDDIRRATPAGDDLIRKIIAELKRDGAVVTVAKGRYAKYRRIRDDFEV